MSFKTPLVLALALAAGVASAAEVPSPTAFPPAVELKALSVQHWTVIANDLAQTTVAELGERAKSGIYVAMPSQDSAFDHELHNFLIDAFHKAGAKVYTRPHDGVLTVHVASHLTAHHNKVDAMPPLMATALTAGVLVVRKIALDNWQTGLLAWSLGQDTLRPLDKAVPRTELAVTVSVDENDVYVARQSNVYYVDNADTGLFRSTGKPLHIQGGN